MKEIWKDIPNYEGLYQVSSLGRVKSLERRVKNKDSFRKVRERILSSNDNGSGYLCVQLSRKLKRENLLIHRLVAICFVKNPKNLPIINHKDGVKTNNAPENLEWCTQMDNIVHSIKNKLVDQKGEKHHSSKLKKEDVIKIRELYKKNHLGYAKIGLLFNVSWGCVRNIVKRKTWNHVP
jgi:hypothetical protein